jgi:hypothetical protein
MNSIFSIIACAIASVTAAPGYFGCMKRQDSAGSTKFPPGRKLSLNTLAQNNAVSGNMKTAHQCLDRMGQQCVPNTKPKRCNMARQMK